MRLDKSELSVLTRLFSAGLIHELGRAGHSSLFARLVQQSPVVRMSAMPETVGETFEAAFDLLRRRGNRDEYVYRSAITQKLLLGRHSLRTASVLHEMRAGSCKADVVVLNGTSTAYEIKSERDSLARLSNQIGNYRGVFGSVSVVTSPDHCHDVLAAVPRDVGVVVLSHRYTLQTVREAENLPQRTSPEMVLQSLRSTEAIAILRGLGVDVPLVPNTQLHTALASLFARLDPADVHNEMVKVLRHSRSQSSLAEYVDALPSSLKTAVLATRLNAAALDRIIHALSTPLEAALAWS